MGNVNTPEYASWEKGFSDGFDRALRILKIAKKFEDTGFEPDRILEEKLKEIEKE